MKANTSEYWYTQAQYYMNKIRDISEKIGRDTYARRAAEVYLDIANTCYHNAREIESHQALGRQRLGGFDYQRWGAVPASMTINQGPTYPYNEKPDAEQIEEAEEDILRQQECLAEALIPAPENEDWVKTAQQWETQEKRDWVKDQNSYVNDRNKW